MLDQLYWLLVYTSMTSPFIGLFLWRWYVPLACMLLWELVGELMLMEYSDWAGTFLMVSGVVVFGLLDYGTAMLAEAWQNYKDALRENTGENG